MIQVLARGRGGKLYEFIIKLLYIPKVLAAASVVNCTFLFLLKIPQIVKLSRKFWIVFLRIFENGFLDIRIWLFNFKKVAILNATCATARQSFFA